MTTPEAAALRLFVQTINATGGLTHGENPGELVPVADEEWLDLADAYLAACEALGVEPVTPGEEHPHAQEEPE